MFSLLCRFMSNCFMDWSARDESHETSFFCICRLLRVVRLLKLSKYSEGLQIMGETLRRSAGSLGMLLFAESIMIIMLSTLAYFSERGSLCTDANDLCQGSAEPKKLGIAGQVPEIGSYAEHGRATVQRVFLSHGVCLWWILKA